VLSKSLAPTLALLGGGGTFKRWGLMGSFPVTGGVAMETLAPPLHLFPPAHEVSGPPPPHPAATDPNQQGQSVMD
jgi:hypothetical protein